MVGVVAGAAEIRILAAMALEHIVIGGAIELIITGKDRVDDGFRSLRDEIIELRHAQVVAIQVPNRRESTRPSPVFIVTSAYARDRASIRVESAP